MIQAKSGLDVLTVASPCPATWDAMSGDEQVRFCRHCQLHVYNLSAMTRDEAEALVSSREGRVCVRFFRRQDGTLLTRDCPIGVRSLRRRAGQMVLALLGLIAFAIAGLAGARTNTRTKLPGPLTQFRLWRSSSMEFEAIMGAVVCDPDSTVPPVQTSPPIEIGSEQSPTTTD